MRITRRNFLHISGAGFVVTASGCGTILHPERRGQPAGPLDWKIVALDAVGLLLFFVPGVIAFAVDFSNGTIYLPPERYGANDRTATQLTSVKVDRGDLAPERLASTVSQHVGRTVRLDEGAYRTEELDTIDEFWSSHDRLKTTAGHHSS